MIKDKPYPVCPEQHTADDPWKPGFRGKLIVPFVFLMSLSAGLSWMGEWYPG